MCGLQLLCAGPGVCQGIDDDDGACASCLEHACTPRRALVLQPDASMIAPHLPQVRKLGPNANPAVLKTLPIASGAMWAFYFG